MGNRYLSLEERFWSRVERKGADECWLWTGGRAGDYGKLRAWGRLDLAHRVSYRLRTGSDAGALWVLHRCDTPLCCNPDHLFLGTVQDNNADMDAKGRRRSAVGVEYRRAVLTDQAVTDIRASAEDEATLAARYGAAGTTIRSARNGRAWKHVMPALSVCRPRPVPVNKATDSQVAEVKRLRSLGQSFGSIARAVGLSRPTVRKYSEVQL